MRKLLVVGGNGNMSGMCADHATDDMAGLLSALTDTSSYEQIVFCFSDQLLQPPDDPEVLLPYIRAAEIAHKTLAAAVAPEELSKLAALSNEDQLEEARKHPAILHDKILRVATSTAVSLLYETTFSFAGGNQVILIFGQHLDRCSDLFKIIIPPILTRDSETIRIRSANLPITSGIKEWPLTFRRFDTDQISIRELAPIEPVHLSFDWTESIPIKEVLAECANLFPGKYPISYPVEDVSKNPRALLVEGDHDGFLLAIPRPSNMKNFSITLRTGKGIKKEAQSKEATGAAPTVERDWMTRSEVAKAIGKSTDTVDNYLRDGKLTANKVDREVRIAKESVQRYLRNA